MSSTATVAVLCLNNALHLKRRISFFQVWLKTFPIEIRMLTYTRSWKKNKRLVPWSIQRKKKSSQMCLWDMLLAKCSYCVYSISFQENHLHDLYYIFGSQLLKWQACIDSVCIACFRALESHLFWRALLDEIFFLGVQVTSHVCPWLTQLHCSSLSNCVDIFSNLQQYSCNHGYLTAKPLNITFWTYVPYSSKTITIASKHERCALFSYISLI